MLNRHSFQKAEPLGAQPKLILIGRASQCLINSHFKNAQPFGAWPTLILIGGASRCSAKAHFKRPSTDLDIGICIYAQLCRQASVSVAALFLQSVGPMGRQDVSPHSSDCGEDSFMAWVGCQVSLPHGGAWGSGLWFGVIRTLPGSCRPAWELV